MSRPMRRSRHWPVVATPRAARLWRSCGDRLPMPGIWPSDRRRARRWRAGLARSRCRPPMPASGLPVVAYAAPVWGETARALPILAAPLFSEVREGGGVVEDDGLLDRLRHLEAGAAQTLLRNIVLEEAGRILRQPADEIDPAQPLSQM